MKEFYEEWTSEEIEDYIRPFGIVVLFETSLFYNEAKIIIHGKCLNDYCKKILEEKITNKFGGQTLTKEMCDKINQFAERWYNKEILLKKARVVNKRRGIQ